MAVQTDIKLHKDQGSDEAYRKSVLENGVRVITERMPFVRSVSLGVWVEAGSRDENVSNRGISHFLEHMIFKGTKNRSSKEIAGSLEDVGGSLNAFTSKELSCYSAHILDEHLPHAVDVIADILLNSVFKNKEIEKEKQVVLKEMDHFKEAPEEMVFERFYESMFRDHPLGWLIYGTPENIRSFGRSDITTFLTNNYTQGRLVVAAAGNVEHDGLVSLVEKHMTMLPAYVRPSRVAPTNNSTDTTHQEPCAQAHVCIGTQSFSYKNPKKFPLLILDTVLGAGMSSRLFQNVREKYGVAYSVYSFADFYSDSGLCGVYVAADTEDLEKCLDLVHSEFRRLQEQVLTEDELEKAKSQLKGNVVLGLENTSSRMARLAKMEIYLHDFFSIDDTLRRIEAVNADDVLQVARELFADGNIHTTQLLPTSDT